MTRELAQIRLPSEAGTFTRCEDEFLQLCIECRDDLDCVAPGFKTLLMKQQS